MKTRDFDFIALVLLGLLTGVLAGLKLTDLFHYSWFAVVAPLLIALLVIVVVEVVRFQRFFRRQH